jgi:hypothetical protein
VANGETNHPPKWSGGSDLLHPVRRKTIRGRARAAGQDYRGDAESYGKPSAADAPQSREPLRQWTDVVCADGKGGEGLHLRKKTLVDLVADLRGAVSFPLSD